MLFFILVLHACLTCSFILYRYRNFSIPDDLISFSWKYKIPNYRAWDKKTIIFPSNDFELANLDYHGITFSEYIYKHSDYISNEIRQKRSWCDCEHIFKIFNKYVKNKYQNMYALDIGANIGACSFLLMAMNIKTIAFEPLPKNLHLFTRSLLHNPQFLPLITLYPMALGNKKSTLKISFNDGNMGGSSALDIFKVGSNIAEVPSDKLNTVLKDFNEPIILAKIDVEGYEPYVIEGADNFLKNHQIKMIFYEKSCKASSVEKYFFNKIDDLFEKYNYTSSKSKCRYSDDLFNILAIANSFIEENNINIDELKRDFF